MQLGILKLPETTTVTSDNLFVVQQPNQTTKISFGNLQFGLDNATFASVVSGHTQQLEYLATTVYSLSTNLYSSFDALEKYVNSAFSVAFNNLKYSLYPVGSIRSTINFVNPSTLLPGTTWSLVSEGKFIAGVGDTYDNGGVYANGDKNNVSVTIAAGENSSLGEYGVSLAVSELPAHTHEASMFGETDSSVAGQFAESEAGPEQFNIAPVTSEPTGSSAYHNNIKPAFGVFFWRRTA